MITAIALGAALIAAATPPAPPAAAPAASRAGREALQAAVRAFESFDDVRAQTELRALLRRQPSNAVAAKAHLYLGLILFDRSQSDPAREEFKQAMVADPGVELPLGMSPKARLAFAEARRQLSREMEASAPPPAPAEPLAAATAPAAATSSETQTGTRRSHWLTWTLGSVGLAAGAVAVYGGVEVLAYNSLAAQAAAKPSSHSASELNATNGPFWSVGWIVAAGVGAVGLAAAPFAW